MNATPFSFFDVLSVLIMYQGLVLCVALPLRHRQQMTSAFWLVGFILTIVLDFFSTLLYATAWVLEWPWAAFAFNTLPLLSGPFLYLYTLRKTRAAFSERPVHLLHALPYALLLGWAVLRYYRFPADRQVAMLQSGEGFPAVELLAIVMLGTGQVIAYLLLSLREIFRYRKRIQDYFSNIDQINYRWLQNLIYGYGAVVVLNVAAHLAEGGGTWQSLYFVAALLNLVYLNTVFFRTWQQPQLPEPETEEKQKTPEAPPEAHLAALQAIEALFEAEKTYTESSLTLDALAKKLPFSAREISAAINQGKNMNFYEFVNGYRLAEAQRMLTDPEQQWLNISEIMYAVGFNSKSSFNTLFKASTGQTPSQFRKGRSAAG